jgi:hypothetical protein
MPKYTVEEALKIIQEFTSEDKSKFLAKLSSVTTDSVTPTIPQRYQEQHFGNISLGSGSALAANQAGGDVRSDQGVVQSLVENINLQEALNILQNLKQNINQSDVLNRLEKTTLEGTIKIIEEETTKPKPDKKLLDQAIDILKSGLKVISLVEPVIKLADLLAKAWMV